MTTGLTNLIYAKTGITINLESLSHDTDTQLMAASLLALAANSDGSFGTEEGVRIVELLGENFDLSEAEALSLLVRAGDELRNRPGLDALIDSLNARLQLPHKEDLLLMILEVVAADGCKEPSELAFFAEVVETLGIPDAVVDRAFTKYWSRRRS